MSESLSRVEQPTPIQQARRMAHQAVTEGVNSKYVDRLRRATYELADYADSLAEALRTLIAECEEDGRCRICWHERGEDHEDRCPVPAALGSVGVGDDDA